MLNLGCMLGRKLDIVPAYTFQGDRTLQFLRGRTVERKSSGTVGLNCHVLHLAEGQPV